MAITVTWSSTDGGSAISEPLNHGSAAAGNILTAQTIFLAHNGTSPITGCVFYIEEKSGTYGGAATPSADLAELLGWGDDSTANGYGGYQLNMDANGSFPALSFPVFNNKQRNQSVTFLTGVGDSPANGVPLPTTMGLTNAQEIPIGTSPGISFQCRIQIPTDEGVAGIRQFDQKLRFTFTS